MTDTNSAQLHASKREEELARIQALKQRFLALKITETPATDTNVPETTPARRATIVTTTPTTQAFLTSTNSSSASNLTNLAKSLVDPPIPTNIESSKQELDSLHTKCENLLVEAKKVAAGIENKLEVEKAELKKLASNLEKREEIESEVLLLSMENQRINDEYKDLLEKSNQGNATAEKPEFWKEKCEENEKLANDLVQQLENLISSQTNKPTENAEKSPLETECIKIRYENEKLIKQLKFLQTTYESEEALARALYKNLGGETVPSPNRCGFLTKQGGSVKSWKRRYFVLKDNFLFYYKKPKDEHPTGIIHLEDFSVDELPEENEKKNNNIFRIITASRTWLLQADRQIEMDIWIDCIKKAKNWWLSDTNITQTNGTPFGTRKEVREKKGSFRLSTYHPAVMAANSQLSKTLIYCTDKRVL